MPLVSEAYIALQCFTAPSEKKKHRQYFFFVLQCHWQTSILAAKGEFCREVLFYTISCQSEGTCSCRLLPVQVFVALQSFLTMIQKNTKGDHSRELFTHKLSTFGVKWKDLKMCLDCIKDLRSLILDKLVRRCILFVVKFSVCLYSLIC